MLQSVKLLMQTIFYIQFSLMLRCASTISKKATLTDCLSTNLTFQTVSRESSPETSEFCTAEGKTMKTREGGIPAASRKVK